MDNKDLLDIRLHVIEVELIKLKSLTGLSCHPDHHLWWYQINALKEEHVIVMSQLKRPYKLDES